MAFKLGLAGSEYTLPAPNWPAGSPIDLAVDIDPKVQSEEMLDGSEDTNIAETDVKRYPLSWISLTAAQMAIFDAIYALRAELNFISEYHGIAGQAVVIESYKPALRMGTYAATPLWRLEMTLKEA